MKEVKTLLGVALCAASWSFAAQIPTTSGQRVAFEVASIKENKSGDASGQTSGVNVGHYTATNVPCTSS
jgi:hypothetical protein